MPGETQVVVQWVIDENSNMENLFKVEDMIEGGCPAGCFVDGNDIGSGTFNIFMYATHPQDAVELIRTLDLSDLLPSGVRVGVAHYTNADRTDWVYKPAYPDDLKEFDLFAKSPAG